VLPALSPCTHTHTHTGPVTREIIPGLVPAHYTPQLLTLMHITGLPVADFVQWRTDTGVFDITEFREDVPKWYSSVHRDIKNFHTLLMDSHMNPEKVPLPKKRKRKAAAPRYTATEPEPPFAEAFDLGPDSPAGGPQALVPGGPPPPLELEPNKD